MKEHHKHSVDKHFTCLELHHIMPNMICHNIYYATYCAMIPRLWGRFGRQGYCVATPLP